jgi:hypothetical protein
MYIRIIQTNYDIRVGHTTITGHSLIFTWPQCYHYQIDKHLSLIYNRLGSVGRWNSPF